ncbi:MAG: nucleoside hydrolase [Bacillota bacterium]|jgi:pyrimidine-specific ribonucleoside hydrolase|nr:nucleoside hydrolase [Bacillota bacterium]NLL26496.1 nucleoside hydrolase [Erysipelotrichia bacterium]
MIKKPINVILDGDPGHDDAIAWVVAKASPEFNILACTAVNGNCSAAKAAYNSQRICALIDLNVPIAKGQDKPLVIESLKAPTNIHGESGLDGPELPLPERELEDLTAVELMIKILEESKEKVTIVATGPLTNVGALLLVRPDLKEKIEQISIMGGGIKHGNWTAAAEFNILIDPDSADIVFKSGLPIFMAGLDVTEKALVTPKDVEEIKQIDNPVAEIVWQWLEFFYQFHLTIGYPGAPIHDLCAVLVLNHPEIFDLKEMYVEIETAGEYTKGATIGDINNITANKPNATVLMDVDREKFVEYMVEAIKCYSEVN